MEGIPKANNKNRKCNTFYDHDSLEFSFHTILIQFSISSHDISRYLILFYCAKLHNVFLIIEGIKAIYIFTTQ